jgi:acyl homoserine lactone synthase
MQQIEIGRAGDATLGPALLDSMYRLRARVFSERLAWEVAVVDGREHDGFDLLGPVYVVATRRDRPLAAHGCCRLLPSTGPNMLRDVFPTLLDGAPAPSAPDIWEVSRFAMDDDGLGESAGFGFADPTVSLVSGLLHHAASRGLSALVGVTSAPFERLLRHMGLRVNRLGRARRIGKVMSLAFELPLDGANLLAVSRLPVPAAAAAVSRAA